MKTAFVVAMMAGCMSEEVKSQSLTGNYQEEMDRALAIYPNPSPDGNITIKFTGINTEALDIAVYTMVGTLVYNAKIRESDVAEYSIDLSDMPSGNYFVSIGNHLDMVTKRIRIRR